MTTVDRSAGRGVCGSLQAKTVVSLGWAESARGIIGPAREWACQQLSRVSGSGGDLLSGVVLGDRRRLAGTATDADFKTTGLTHLVAVSGSHLVVVAAVFAWLLGVVGTGRLLRSSAIAILLAGYVAFSGVQSSAMRAWVMAVAVSMAWLGGRRIDGGAALAAAATAMLVVSPVSAFDLGFQLSVAAVAGLVLFANLGETWLAAALPRVLQPVAGAASLTLAATVATIPLTAPLFGMLSLISPLANLLVGPIVSAMLVVGLAGLAIAAVHVSAGNLLLQAAGAMGECASWVASLLASWPRAAVPLSVPVWATVIILVLALLVWAVWPAPTRTRARGLLLVLAVGVLAIAWSPRVGGGPQIVMLDVGQGDAILVQDGSHSLLVDTGPSPSKLRLALARQGVRTLDGVIITHLHDDHYGGLSALDGLVTVGFVAFPAGSLASNSPAIDDAHEVAGSHFVRTARR